MQLPEILFVSSYPPRVCGIATYSYDLLVALNEKFGKSFSFKVCALEKKQVENRYSNEVKYVINTSDIDEYEFLANELNGDDNLQMIVLQHEFGLFGGELGNYLLNFLSKLTKPVITTFHTVLPNPDLATKKLVEQIASLSESIIAMTKNGAAILTNHYKAIAKKITVIPHGTHLISTIKGNKMWDEIYFGDRVVLSTFGLLSSGKSIETALDALPSIIEKFPKVIYLIIGKTHPEVVKEEGEAYRDFLVEKVANNKLENHVLFINQYLPLERLLEYLQRTDIYLFTSKNPNQAVSGTLAYAMGCGCAVISTPIPHAKELLDGAGITVDFQNAKQLANGTIRLLGDPALLKQMRLNALHKIGPTAWQNVAIAYMGLAQENTVEKIDLQFEMPPILLDHVCRLTTDVGMIQFSKIAVPDLQSGYTLDDNARALIAVAKHYKMHRNLLNAELINIYVDFILSCQQADGSFLNYMDIDGAFMEKNKDENLEDSNGRAIWALGEFLSFADFLPVVYISRAMNAIEKSLRHISTFQSPRAIAFVIKGLHHYYAYRNNPMTKNMITLLADNLVSKYRAVLDRGWEWYENYLTYANSLLPEAMLYAWKTTGNILYETIAISTFDFLLKHIFKGGQIKVISNQGWHQKDKVANQFGEQPIDIAYTILALDLFYEVFQDESYLHKMQTSFAWFLGKNHLHQIVYNPSTGGCYDGLEEHHVNLNQGAESTVSYLLARLTMEKYKERQQIFSDADQLQQIENKYDKVF